MRLVVNRRLRRRQIRTFLRLLRAASQPCSRFPPSGLHSSVLRTCISSGEHYVSDVERHTQWQIKLVKAYQIANVSSALAPCTPHMTNETQPLTEGHLNLICNTLNSHERERNHGNDWDHAPSELLDQCEWKSKQVQRDALLQVNAV